MSVSFDDGSGDGQRWPRVRSFIAHKQIELLIGWLVLLLVLFGLIEGWSTWVQTPIAIAIVIGVVTIEAKALRGHATQFCQRCLDEVPWDGKYDAEKNMNWLKWFHFFERPRNVLAHFGVILVGAILMPTWMFYLLIVAVNVPVLRSANHHRRLSLWCPICHPDDDGGGNDFTPVPDPVIEGKKVR